MTSLPPGYRFYPTEEELICFYLRNKLDNTRDDIERDIERVIPVVHVYGYDPWQLPQFSGEPCVRDTEQWFFFCPRQQREAHGGRPMRTTPAGYWKATGSPGYVYSSANRAIGVKKTMVFYRGKAPNGNKTLWKMNEYRALVEGSTPTPSAAPQLRREFSLCRVYIKSGCLRSFDRRPSVAATSESQRMQEASSSAENPSMAERTGYHDSSSPDDHGLHHFASGGATDGNVLDYINWDSLDWD